MNELINKACYIICFRASNAERLRALLFVIRRLRKTFPTLEIMIVEQDSETRLGGLEELNVRHLFIQNSSLFNRSWAFNCGVQNTNKEIFIFGDADILMEETGFLQCLNAMEDFEAVTPNKREIINIAIDETNEDQFLHLNKRAIYSFAGGILFMTRKGFEKIGGWDEDFEGWGGEDNAMSHVIYSILKSKTFDIEWFHIDHSREFTEGSLPAQYEANRNLVDELITRNGKALTNYIQQLKSWDLGNPMKYVELKNKKSSEPLKFVLAITTYNRLDQLKKCVTSFLETKSNTISWKLIIADDNSTDGTKEYLKTLEENYDAIIIHNNNSHIHNQVNSILSFLSEMTYDLCFRCDDDVEFIKDGWDLLYWTVIDRTGYDHLVFYDKSWNSYANHERPIRSGRLISNCKAEDIQGAMYTITRRVIKDVGYFDTQQFGRSGLGHVDYSFRCCRAGYNVLSNPFDIEESNNFIRLQSASNFASASTLKSKHETNSKEILASKKKLLRRDRIRIAYNENHHNDSLKNQKKSNLPKSIGLNKSTVSRYQKADATFYPERGLSGFIGFLFKRVYNKSIDWKFYFIPRSIKFVGKALNKISIHLINIDQ